MTPPRRSRDRGEQEVLFGASTSERRARRALIASGLLIAAGLAVTFGFFEYRAEGLLRQQQLVQARAFVHEVMAARRFVALHGGVYVPESDETKVNPFLERVPGLKPRIVDEDGEAYVLRNPALVTQAIGDLLAEDSSSDIEFRLTSDRPLNPENRASGFEAEALRRFEDGAYEHHASVHIDGEDYFAYARPLSTEAECLRCHGSQGYHVGDVRGAISMRVRSEVLESAIVASRSRAAALFVVSVAALLAVLYVISGHLLRGLLRAESRLRDLATYDALTGVANRRMGLSRLEDEIERADRTGQPLGVLMLDLDRFKEVNDRWGHQTGDRVLTAAALAMREHARSYDTVARMGGEEFLVLLPGMSAEDATQVAERIRASVAERTGEALAEKGTVSTVSVGIAVYVGGSGETEDALLARADAALYAAKDAGRDTWRLSEAS